MRPLARRWRLQSLMIAVAVVAAGLGAWRTIERRRAEFSRRFQLHSDEEMGYRRGGSRWTCVNATCPEYYSEGYPPTPSGNHAHPAGGLLKRAEREWLGYHASLSEKYWRAWKRPWLAVADDPPPPPRPLPRQ